MEATRSGGRLCRTCHVKDRVEELEEAACGGPLAERQARAGEQSARDGEGEAPPAEGGEDGGDERCEWDEEEDRAEGGDDEPRERIACRGREGEEVRRLDAAWEELRRR